MINDFRDKWLIPFIIIAGAEALYSSMSAIHADDREMVEQSSFSEAMECFGFVHKVIVDNEDKPYRSVGAYNSQIKRDKECQEKMKRYADGIRIQFPHFSDIQMVKRNTILPNQEMVCGYFVETYDDAKKIYIYDARNIKTSATPDTIRENAIEIFYASQKKTIPTKFFPSGGQPTA